MNLICCCFALLGLLSVVQGLRLDFNTIRLKRQTFANCSEYEFRCGDGTCIEDYQQCNGVVECPDGSDETIESCVYNFCPAYAFRCTYGACVSGKMECNGHKDCIDNSDEQTLNCPGVKESLSRTGTCGDQKYQCNSGECIHEDQVCNGNSDCSDQSDENSEICSSHFCPAYALRCSYGACVQGNSRCNKIRDCVDGSDEADCGYPAPTTPTPLAPSSDNCAIPVLENGYVRSAANKRIYSAQDVAQHGEGLEFVCQQNTILLGQSITNCIEGSLLTPPPRCIKGCPTLPLDTISVRATCADRALNQFPCTEVVPFGTWARLQCKVGYRKPNGTFEDTIYCQEDGQWSSHIPRCTPRCGEITFGVPFISGGRVANISMAPWHVAIYENQSTQYEQICGGSIISVTAILSAAHCFWNEDSDSVKASSLFAVVAGKTLRDYGTMEPSTQILSVDTIEVTQGYSGRISLYAGDIAVLKLRSPIIYDINIVPICIPTETFADKDMASGTTGRVVGWGVTEDNVSSSVLKVVDLEAVDHRTCKERAEKSFLPYILPDKFCATRANENVCQGDSGGGFTEARAYGDSVRYYLRGLVSVGSKMGQVECTAVRTYTTFTNVLYYDTIFYKYIQV